MNYCHVVIGGRLTHDPRVRGTSSGTSVCSASLAINRKYRRGDDWHEEACFVDVTIFGKSGEAFAKHHGKGDPVFISGSLRFNRWEDMTTGEMRSKLYVVADDWQFVKPKAASAEKHEPDLGGGAW